MSQFIKVDKGPKDWEIEWQTGVLEEKKLQDGIEWIKARPDCIKEIMLKFPPSCLVISNKNFKSLRVKSFGIVTSYFEDGTLGVRQHPTASFYGIIDPKYLTVVGYYKQLTLEKIAEILSK